MEQSKQTAMHRAHMINDAGNFSQNAALSTNISQIWNKFNSSIQGPTKIVFVFSVNC